MNDWQEVQRALYPLLQAHGRCFLRVSRSHDALWVCDLSRSPGDTALALRDMRALQVLCRREEGKNLWLLDMEPEWYRELESSLPQEIPPFPADYGLHEAYALCRLLLLHPAPLKHQPMEPIRAVLKLTAGVIQDGNAWTALHQQCAKRLRTSEALPTLAGALLAQWITEQE